MRKLSRYARGAIFVSVVVAAFCGGAVLLVKHPIIGTLILVTAVVALVLAVVAGRPKAGPPILRSWNYQDEDEDETERIEALKQPWPRNFAVFSEPPKQREASE